MSKRRLRGYVRCPTCMHIFYSDTFTEKSRKRKCKCGNIDMGIMKVEDSRYSFFITVSYSEDEPEYGDV